MNNPCIRYRISILQAMIRQNSLVPRLVAKGAEFQQNCNAVFFEMFAELEFILHERILYILIVDMHLYTDGCLQRSLLAVLTT